MREDVLHLHNAALQTAAESGLLALVALATFVAAAMRASLHTARAEASASRRDLGLAALLALTAWATMGVFEDNWGDTEVQRLLFFFVAIPGYLASAATSES